MPDTSRICFEVEPEVARRVKRLSDPLQRLEALKAHFMKEAATDPLKQPAVAELIAELERDAAGVKDLPENPDTAHRLDAARTLMWDKNVELPPRHGATSRAPAKLLHLLHHALVTVIADQGHEVAGELASRARDTLGLTSSRYTLPGGAAPTTDMDVDPDDTAGRAGPSRQVNAAISDVPGEQPGTADYLAAAQQYAGDHNRSNADVPGEPRPYRRLGAADYLAAAQQYAGDHNGSNADVSDRPWPYRRPGTVEYLAAAQQYADSNDGSIAGMPDSHEETVNGQEIQVGRWIQRLRDRDIRVDDKTATLLNWMDMDWEPGSSRQTSQAATFLAAVRQYAADNGGSVADMPSRHTEMVGGRYLRVGAWLAAVRTGRTNVDAETREALNGLGVFSQIRSQRGRDTHTPRSAAVGRVSQARRSAPGAAAVPAAVSETASAASGSHVAGSSAVPAGSAPMSSVASAAARRGLRIGQVPSDGDCLVTSVAQVLERSEGVSWSGPGVRAAIARALDEDLARAADARQMWPRLDQVVLQHTAEVMAGVLYGAGAAGPLRQEQVNNIAGGLQEAGGVTDGHRQAFRNLIATPGQWMSGAGDAIPEIAALTWGLRIEVTQVAIPAAGDVQVSVFSVGQGERVVHLVRQFHVTADGASTGEHWSPAIPDPDLIAGLGQANLDPSPLSGSGPVVMRVETDDHRDAVRPEVVGAFLSADAAGRQGLGRILSSFPAPTRQRPTETVAPDTVLARLNPEVRPAVRSWEMPVAEEVERLTAILRTAGSRSLVFSTGWENPVWALNINGTIRWFSSAFAPVAAPQDADDHFYSIDINDQGQLTGPRAQELKAAGATAFNTVKTGYCDVNIGTDLNAALGW